MYIPKHLKFIRLKDKGRTLLVSRNIAKGEVILKMKGTMKNAINSSPQSVQIDEDKFIDSEYHYADDYINHSCNPNIWLNIINMNYIALRNIKKGEEIARNYLTTEYDSCDFKCKCSSKSCLKHIRGFKYLTKKQKEKLKPFLSPFLKKKLLNNK